MLAAKYFSTFRRFDWILYASVMLLMFFGLAVLYSFNLSIEGGDFLNFKKQLFFVVSGSCLMVIVSLIDYRIFKNYSRFLYLLALFLLLAVLVVGSNIRGTKGWFVLGIFNFQPVELVKLISIIFIAKYMTEWARLINQFKHIFISGLGVFILFLLVMIQPDFGSAIVMFFVWFIMTLVVGIKKSHFFLMMFLFLLIGSVVWVGALRDYQKDRILAFLNPGSDPQGRGYNLVQSKIAVGSGGLYGRGLTQGSQSQLRFLPESQTDFIFAALAEQLGFVGVSLLLLFFGVILFRIAKIARRARDDFGLFLVLGIMIAFFVQVFVNVGMNLGVSPVTGISLPFVSYGGSYLFACLVMIGLVQAVHIHSKQSFC